MDEGVKVLIGDAVDPDLLREAGAEKADVLLALTREGKHQFDGGSDRPHRLQGSENDRRCL